MLVMPELITLDIFGTVLDWQTGLTAACKAAGRPITLGEFDRIIDAQGELEQGEFINYTEVTARSLHCVLGLDREVASKIGASVGGWPLYADAKAALRALAHVSPCAAMTNSDHVHGEKIQRQLGMRMDWLCAEETRVYKPDPLFWNLMAERRGIKPSNRWWHVSAYADYDLAVANALGLTTVFIRRAHCRSGTAAHSLSDLNELVRLVSCSS